MQLSVNARKAKDIIDSNGGIENFRCYALLQSDDVSNDLNSTWVECKLNPKNTVISPCGTVAICCEYPIENSTMRVYREISFNHDEFVQAIEDGTIVVKTESTHIDKTRWFEPICGCAYIEHEADIIVQ